MPIYESHKHCSALAACSIWNCWTPLLDCKIRSLFHLLSVRLAQPVFQSFSLASTYFQRFLKAQLAGISPPCRRGMKTQGLPLSLRGIYLLCSAFITLWWFRVHVNPDIHCANVIFWIGPRTTYLALACDQMAAGTRLVGEPCYEYSLTCQDLLKEQTIPIETQCKVQLGVLC